MGYMLPIFNFLHCIVTNFIFPHVQVFRIFPSPWYFSHDTITKDMLTNTSVPLNCITEFVLFFPKGSRKSSPFPFRCKEMFDDGYPKRLYSNSILVPPLPVKQRLRALQNAQNPKQVLDEDEQQPMSWFQMFCLFTKHTDDLPVVLSIGSGVGVVLLLLLFALFACGFSTSHCFNIKAKHLAAFYGMKFFFWCYHKFRCL